MTLDELVTDTALAVPDTPRASIQDMLRWAARELCDQGNAWVVKQSLAASGEPPSAELAAPEGAEPLRVINLAFPHRQTAPDRVEFQRYPGDEVIARVAVRPLPGQDLPETLLSRYAETLRHGALARLLLLPQPWRDPELALDHRRQWLAGITEAKSQATHGFQRGGARVRPRRFV